MAGNYPDAPGHRHAYHRDGTVMFKIDSVNSVTQISNSLLQDLNNELSGSAIPSITGPSGNFYYGFIFPELRTVNAIAIGALTNTFWADSLYPRELQYSNDTTNGLDGTWTLSSLSGQIGPHLTDRPGMRTSFSNVTGIVSVKAIRWRMYYGRDAINLYHTFLYGPGGGGIAVDSDRLCLWHPTLNQEVGAAHFDWGNVPRGSSADKTFRVRNESNTLTANNINIGSSAIDDTTPSFAGQHLFSTDGLTFSSSVIIASLAPNTISGTITVRKVTPSNATLSVWYAQISAVAGSWT